MQGHEEPRSSARAARVRARSVAAVVLATALALAACGERDPVDALEDAHADLASARERRAEADATVEQLRGELAELEEALAEAERDATAAAAHEREAEQELAAVASDELLFRVVQSRLLEDRELADAAVRAEVEQGVVTLRGRVESARAAERAVAIAADTPGVVRVASQLRVPAPAVEP